jgi:hypothetical protein
MIRTASAMAARWYVIAAFVAVPALALGVALLKSL